MSHIPPLSSDASPSSTLIPFDLLYVVYDDSSYISWMAAAITYTPYVVGIMLTTLILFRRELESAYQLCGCVTSTIINAILKRLIKDPRPAGSVKTGYGMPSDHSQFVMFMTVYATMWMMTKVHFDRVIYKHLISISGVLCALAVCVSRIHLGVHTPAQVYVGCFVGSIFGFLWFMLGKFFIYPYVYPWIEQHPWAKFLYIKDSSSIPNVLYFEYIQHHAYRAKCADHHHHMHLCSHRFLENDNDDVDQARHTGGKVDGHVIRNSRKQQRDDIHDRDSSPAKSTRSQKRASTSSRKEK